MLNSLVIIGALKTEVSLDQVKGKYVANYSILSDRIQKGKSDLLPCVVWDKKAVSASKLLHKGSLVALRGRVETEYEIDKRTGLKHLTFKLVVQEQFFLSYDKKNNDDTIQYDLPEEFHY